MWRDRGIVRLGTRRRLRLQALEDRVLLSASHPFELADLLPPAGDGSSGFVAHGVEAPDYAGESVDSAGDFNGDGYDDLLIGAMGAYRGNAPHAPGHQGEAYVVFGKQSGFDAELDLGALDGTGGFVIRAPIDANSINGAEFGRSVSGLGDVNGDGYSDIMIGAPNVDPIGGTDAGTSYVLFGHPTDGEATVDASQLNGSNGFAIAAYHPGEYSGMSVSSAGDFNGDGYQDIAIKAPGAANANGHSSGKVYIVYGKASGYLPTFQLTDLNLDGSKAMVITDAPGGERSNATIRTVGDVNGDGFSDLIIGGPGDDPAGRANAGAAYVVFGSDTYVGRVPLAGLTGGLDGFSIHGAVPGNRVGVSVAGRGDIDGDGRSDLILGAEGPPEAYVLYTGALETTTFESEPGVEVIRYSDVELGSLAGGDGSRGTVIRGMDPPDAFFLSLGSDRHDTPMVASAGDTNGDGLDDLILGTPFDSPGNRGPFQPGYLAGQSHVIFGRDGGLGPILNLAALDGNNGFSLDGYDLMGLSGTSVASAQDIDGNGFSDLLLGAPNTNEGPNETGGAGAGESYLVFGDDWTGAVTGPGTAGNDTLSGSTASDDILVGGQGNDVLRGMGLFGDGTDDRDVLLGGEGNDRLVVTGSHFRRIAGGNGWDTLQVGTSCLVLDDVHPSVLKNESCPGIELDLTTLPDTRLTGIEEIDLTPAGIDVLKLDVHRVLNLSDTSNTLVVRGSVYDQVILDDGWTAAGMELRGGEPFHVFRQGAATLKMSSLLVDSDEDGLPDVWEMPDDLDVDGDGQIDVLAGIDLDANGTFAGDGSVELKLADLGATPDHKDLFVEVDAMTDRAPAETTTAHHDDVDHAQLATGTSLDEVVYAFLTAPVANPDGINGIRLHLDVDDTTPRVSKWGFGGADPWDDFQAYKDDYFGHADDSDAVKDAKRLAYRYAVFADEYWDSAAGSWNSSGKAEIRGNDFFVTLGNWSTAGGTVAEQQGTFMHELGHTLDLRHGGADDINYKPNYHSVMNYHWQVPSQNTGWTLDYSRSNVSALDESRLDEAAGIGFPAGNGHDGHTLRLGPTSNQFVAEVGAVDWSNVANAANGDDQDHDGNVDNDTDIVRDVNQDGAFGVLVGHDDWHNMALAVRGSENFLAGIPAEEVGDMTLEIYEQLSHFVLVGGPDDDWLMGGSEAEVLIGGDGNDTLVETGGQDILRGAAGDDILVLPSGDFGRLDGGRGEDVLRLDGAGIELALTEIPDRDISNVEAIDIRGSGPNTLSLDVEEVLNLSQTSDTLTVWADPDDILVREPVWSDVGRDVIDGQLLTVYTASLATLKVSGAVPVPGDLNIDGRVDFDDIAALVEGLNDPQGYQAGRGLRPAVHGDMDQDGNFDFDDIDPFVAVLITASRSDVVVPPVESVSPLTVPGGAALSGPWDPNSLLARPRLPALPTLPAVADRGETPAVAPVERPHDRRYRQTRPAVRSLAAAAPIHHANRAGPLTGHEREVDTVMAGTYGKALSSVHLPAGP